MARPGIQPRTSDLQDRCTTDYATQPGFLSVSHFRIFASFDSLCRGSILVLYINQSVLQTEELGYFQTVFIVSKVQPCILVSFVFRLSLGLVGGGQTGTSVKSLKR